MKIYLSFILLNIFVEIQSLVELSLVEDNSIAITVIAIQNILNNLLTSFKFQNVKYSPELKQYFAIHDLFVSITLRDCDNWKKIVTLSRVNYIDNKTIYFIAQINEVLDEGINNKSADDIDSNIYVERCINTFIGKLEYLKEWYSTKRNDFVNGEILNNFDLMKLKHDAINNNSKSNDESKYSIINNEFWQLSHRRIYKGSRTNIKDFPFMASVQFFGRFQCAGSIIKSDLVITAASCLQLAYNNRFFLENPSYLTIQIGSHFYEHGGEIVQIQKIYFHPKYNPKILRHNLALMRMTKKVAFETKFGRVKKIDFDRKVRSLFDHDRITIIGWGDRDNGNINQIVAQNKLSYAKLNFYPLKECQEYYSKTYVTKLNFCAGFISKGSGACNHDVGGPGVINNMLVGVISFASPVCGAPGPTVFTRVSYYAKWINGIMKQDVPNIAVATTKLPPKINYKDIDTETTTSEIFTLMKPLRMNKQKEDLSSGADKIHDNILSNEHLDERIIEGNDLLPSTIASGSKKNKKQVKPKTKKKKTKSKSTVTTTVRYTRNLIKRKKAPIHMYTVGIPLQVKMTTKQKKTKDKDDGSIENDIINIINRLDIDRIVKSIGPDLVSRFGVDVLERKKKTKENKERKTTKRFAIQGRTEVKRFLL